MQSAESTALRQSGLSAEMAHLDDDEYEIPLRDQRYFGAGIKRKRVQFVSSQQTQQTTSLPATPKESAADRYLAIVLDKSNGEPVRAASAPPVEQAPPGETDQPDESYKHEDEGALPDETDKPQVCDVCYRSIPASTSKASHESSIAHQLALPHSHPPSHLDRQRKGLTVLQSHGWDPDSRLGLGAQGEGIRQPIRATENPNRAGLGAKLAPARVMEKPVSLDAGKVRLREQEGKKKAERLRNDFYGKDDVQKYLGEMGGKGEGIHGLDLDAFKRKKKRR